nr:MAG TPA: hypothetical protein [Caudoviricetes sp.]
MIKVWEYNTNSNNEFWMHYHDVIRNLNIKKMKKRGYEV